MINHNDTHPITFNLACSMLAKKSVNVRIHDLILQGKKDRAMRFLFNRAVAFLDDIDREDTEGMDPDVLTAGNRILTRGFGPMIARDLMDACRNEVMTLLRADRS